MNSAQKTSSGFQKFFEEQIERLVKGLDNLTEGDLGIAMLVACGERAIPPLRRCLLRGKPSTVFTGRQRAVKALSELGAWTVLLEYLTEPKAITDPSIRYSEEAVENTAARELAHWQTDEVFAGLLSVLQRRSLPGAIEAVARFERREAIPILIHALEDDVARPAAKDALRSLRSLAMPDLLQSARSPEPSATSEFAGSVLRRRAALQVLSEGPLTVDDWDALRFLLYEPDPGLAVLASSIALQFGSESDKLRANAVAIDCLDSPDWTVVAEAERELIQNLQAARGEIEKEIWECLSNRDAVHREKLRLFYAVVRKGQEQSRGAA